MPKSVSVTNLLLDLRRFEEANSLMLKTMPVARRILGEGHIVTLRMRWNYAMALYLNTDATLDDARGGRGPRRGAVRGGRLLGFFFSAPANNFTLRYQCFQLREVPWQVLVQVIIL